MTFENKKTNFLIRNKVKLSTGFLSVLILSIAAIPMFNQEAYATTFILDGQASCESSPFFGTWDGSFTCTVTNLTINNGDILEVNGVTMEFTGTLDNFGFMNVTDGNIALSGTINNNGLWDSNSIQNFGGTINNDGILNNFDVFNNEVGSTFNNSGIYNNAEFNCSLGNQGTIINSGTMNILFSQIDNSGPGIFVNTGTINNQAELINSNLTTGSFDNDGIINNTDGTLLNDTLLDNQGTICGGTVINLGTITGNPPEPMCAIGELKISKLTTGGDTTFSFTVSGTSGLSPSVTTSGGIGMHATNVIIGTYSIQEIPIPSGWTLTTASCNDGSSTFSVDTVSGIIINENDNIECTFENTFTVPPQFCNGLTATIVGTAGDDFINGTAADDVIVGLGGNDFIFGNDGKDTICGGDGNDLIKGNKGQDTLFGEAGKDTIMGGLGKDTIEGGDGADVLFGRQGADTLKGNAGDDRLLGGEGNDSLTGNAGDDHVIGGDGDDSLNGNGGFDVCDDSEGTDTTSNCELTS